MKYLELGFALIIAIGIGFIIGTIFGAFNPNKIICDCQDGSCKCGKE